MEFVVTSANDEAREDDLDEALPEIESDEGQESSDMVMLSRPRLRLRRIQYQQGMKRSPG